jgi:NADP-dependent 3-hydroxy acid dehydrogenase YdfG
MAQMVIFAKAAVAQHGHVDVLINNAGIALAPTQFEAIAEDDASRVIDVNMWGVYNGIRAFLPHLRARPEASLVTISSLAGLIGLTGYGPYAMSKFAGRALSEVIEMESVGTGLRVLLVYPGGIKTNLIRNAPNLAESDREEAHEAFAQISFLTADRAAKRIVRAIQHNRRRLILGFDAKLACVVRCLLPRCYPAVLQAVFSRMVFK